MAAVFVAALAIIQLASYSFDARAAMPSSLPAHVPIGFGQAVYSGLEVIAPAPYVEIALARDALRRGDLQNSREHAVRLPASAQRDELLGQIARARGDGVVAWEYFLAAPDPEAFDRIIRAAAARDPGAAYAYEAMLATRLNALNLHPDAVAQARWRMGELAGAQAQREIGEAKLRWQTTAMHDLAAAAALAPFSNKYALAAGNQAVALRDSHGAAVYFTQALAANPGSADAVAGLGVVALQTGRRQQALQQLARARRIDSHAAMVQALQRALSAR